MKIVENITEKSYFPMIKYALYKNFEMLSVTNFNGHIPYKYIPYEGNIPEEDEILYLFHNQKLFEINFYELEEDYSYKLKKKEELESIAVLSVFSNSFEWIEKYILPLYFILFEENFIDVLIECAIDNEYHEMFVLLLEFKNKHNLYSEPDWRL